jgi:hypothetical protein
MICYTILNGPSSVSWRDQKLKGPLFGCNFAYKHFDLDHCFAVDMQMVKRIIDDEPQGIWLYTKHRNQTPRGWRGKVIPGIDSGSFAFERALLLYPDHEHFIIGADGILKHSHDTVYEYDWHTRSNRPTSHNIHRQTFVKLIEQYQPNYWFVSDTPDTELRTLKHEDAKRKASMELSSKRSK